MIKISNRNKILKAILAKEGAFEFANNRDSGIIPFLNEIWDLKALPSEDNRFRTAERDIIQHTINNDDWTWEYLFEERLKLLEDEVKFPKFLEKFLLPAYQISAEDTSSFVDLINPILKDDDLVLVNVGFEDERPIYEISDFERLDRPSDIPPNKIPFFIINNPEQRADRYVENLKTDREKPSKYFVLVTVKWDDFHHKTTYELVFFDGSSKTEVGQVKIGTNKGLITQEYIEEEFTSLSLDFISLGQTPEYYITMQKLLGVHLKSVLFSLKDAAFFADISENFENHDVFKKSLIREDEAERVYRTARSMIYGKDLNNLYSFDYEFKPKYADVPVTVPFHFSSDGYLPKRLIAVIGKNGSGKTQLLTSLPKDIARDNNDALKPQVPLFSKVIAVSYSTFDNFELPKKTSEFNYIYCGLRDDNGDVRSKQGQLQKFHNTWKKIESLGRLEKWKSIISNFIEVELIELFIKESPDDADTLYFYKAGFSRARLSLSSGQSIVLFVVSEIVANIRFDSLILFDEPETHLHPNAISRLMNGIIKLVHEFESYCVIATHSPIIVQELFSRDVLVFTREGKFPSIKNIGVESFGENLSVITEEVFGNRTVSKNYEKVLNRLVKRYQTYEQVVEVLRKDNLPISLNVRLFIQSLVEQNAKN